METKSEFLGQLQAGALRYLSVVPSEVNVRLYREIAVVTGRVQLRVALATQELAVAARFMEVYVWRNGRWQLLAWQSTRTPE